MLLLIMAAIGLPRTLADPISQTLLSFNLTLPPTTAMRNLTGNWVTLPNRSATHPNATLRGSVALGGNDSEMSFGFTGTDLYVNGVLVDGTMLQLGMIRDNDPSGDPLIQNWLYNDTIDSPGHATTFPAQTAFGPQRPKVYASGTPPASGDATIDWYIDSLTFTTGMITQATSFASLQPDKLFFSSGGALNKVFSWVDGKGSWQGKTPDPEGSVECAEATVSAAALESPTAQDMPQVNIDLPGNASFVIVRGTVGRNYSGATMTLFPKGGSPPPSWLLSKISGNCTNGLLVSNQVLFFSPVDPTEQYSITIAINPPVGKNTATLGISLQDITYYYSLSTLGQGQGASNAPSKTTIISAAAIGGVAIILGLVVLTWWLTMRRIRRQRSSMMADVSIDDRDIAPFSSAITEKSTLDSIRTPLLANPAPAPRHVLPVFLQEDHEPEHNRDCNHDRDRDFDMADVVLSPVTPTRARDSVQLPPLYDPRWSQLPLISAPPTPTPAPKVPPGAASASSVVRSVPTHTPPAGNFGGRRSPSPSIPPPPLDRLDEFPRDVKHGFF